MARQKEFDRADALRRALELFWTRGYDGTSVNDLTLAMGLSRSSLYETFGDKQELFLEAITRYIASMDSRRTAVLAGAGPVRDRLARYFAGAVTFLLDPARPGGCFFTNTAIALDSMDARVRAAIRKGDARQEADFRACIEEGQRTGELARRDDPRAVARFLVGLLRGLTVLARMHRDRKTLEDVVAVGLGGLG